MRSAGLDAAWLAALRASAARPPARARVPLLAAGVNPVTAQVIGSVEPGFLLPLAALRLPDGRAVLENSGVHGWLVHGEVTAGLALMATALREAGLAHAWRDEQLAVNDEEGRVIGTVERAVVRVLGITTRAVHLVGLSDDGRVWLQLRSKSKANDPGLWDTLMGGMIAASDTLESALERETWEEAGLVLSGLQAVTWGGRITTRKPAYHGGGAGYVVEHIDWFRCTVPQGMTPQNQDGEVERFELVSTAAIAARLMGDEFTTEAALILCDALQG
jgi:8-oxo-dGTP pyrophosphatase MutT (NUDIX family)